MNFSYQFQHTFDNLSGIFNGFSLLSGPVLSLLSYVLTGIALYTLAERRGINHPWLAWIPVANLWLLGSLSDQYRYVVRGEIRSKRKVLLILSILSAILGAVVTGMTVSVAVGLVSGFFGGSSPEAVLRSLMTPGIGLLGLALPALGLAIAKTVIRYMALYDIYTSCDPQNNALFTILSILFSFTTAFFLFFCRNRDYGMPPRREPQTPPPVWENTVESDM